MTTATSLRRLADSRRWVEEGTLLCARAVDVLADEQYGEPSALPRWNRAHLVAHLAANAEALRNLARWAATDEVTPMYSSPEQRNADIERGATRSPAALRTWFHEAAAALTADLDRLGDDQWRARVHTAQGREVPASEVPWLRAREVMVHAVDLAVGVTFADLPDDFLTALEADIHEKRGAGVLGIEGALADRVGYLAGRTTAGVTAGGAPAPDLPPWL
ncbi:maleylpyruvate isomerase family mycothiol-dependent enzyme [Nocardioides guangzhouensis]|uniref:Maleylpyruvate isomerase family mycothiol-dependent enzyme n=1 Tax=Nocardioides guangzhouensis TaxID=2497878 RepID=A0A4Q4ZHL3_9ACTN|nr:maleylpyruvate isomerase family mycothiol-dependent enzyme [Nocardioides guangzhouensis]RYP87722.1 maleylpyruvate isomerase family mycothiol-dependent enzyme [Nocardioides guangzhouensis]